jgi:hypothetical protein
MKACPITISPCHRRSVSAFFAAIPVCAGSAAAQVSWDGECGNNFWHSTCGNPPTTTNWMPNVIPAAGDSVSISGTLVHIFGTFAECNSISCSSGLNITNGGQLYCHGAGGTVQNLALTNASVAVGAGGVLEISGTGTTNGGVFYGPGTIYHTGTLAGLSLVVENNPPPTPSFTNGGWLIVSSIQIDPGAAMVNGFGTVTLVPNQQTNGGGINASSGGTGLFVNNGELITAHDGTAHSQFTIGCVLQQDGGGLRVQGQPNLLGTIINNHATFNGGEITVEDDGLLRFWSGTHEFNAPVPITGEGNVILSLSAAPGAGWLVGSTLDVDLSGTTGFMLDTGHLALENGTVHNTGKALWKGTTIERRDCDRCDSRFHNEGDLTIDSFSAVKLDATFENDATVHQVHGHLILDDDAHFSNDSLGAEYELRSGNITRLNSDTLSEFVNDGGTLTKPDLTETTDSLITAVFRNKPPGQVSVHSSVLTFGMGCLRMEGGQFTVDDPREGGAEIALSGDTHVAPDFQTRILGTGTFRVTGGTLRIDGQAEVVNEMTSPDRGFIIGASGRVGGTGMFRNQGFLTIKGGTIGVTNGMGGFSANVVNEATTFIQDGTATVKGTFTNGLDATTSNINGHLVIDGGLVVNQGHWLFDAGTMFVSGSGLFLNVAAGGAASEGPNANGVFRCDVEPNQTVSVSCAFDNRGTVSAATGNVVFGGPVAQLQGGVISGGVWVVVTGASLDLPGTITAIAPGTTIGAGGTFNDLRTLGLNQGALTASGQAICGQDNLCNNHNQRLVNEGAVTLTRSADGSASLTVDGAVDNGLLGLVAAQPLFSVAEGAREAGGGGGEPFIALDCDALNNAGTVAPGGADAPGAFSMIGDFNQSTEVTGVLAIELGGLAPIDQHDQLIVDGDVSLGGTLHVTVLPGFVPEGGEQFTIVTATGTISGTFDQITGPGQYSTQYLPNSVVLALGVPPVPGDVTNDGVVNVADLVAVISAWGACPPGSCPADLNGDGAVSVADLIIVISNWG